MSMCSLLLCCWKRVFAMTSAFSWQNSVSLCPASFRIPRPNLPVTPGVSWLPTFSFQSPIMKRTSFLGVSRPFRTVQLQLLQLYWLGHRLGLLWYWMAWESLGLQGDPPIHSKGDQSWVFFGRTDAKAETLILWQPHAKSWLIGKDSDAGRDWRQEEKGTTEDEMAGWHHRLYGHEFEWTPGVGDGWWGWRAAVYGVAKSPTWLSNRTELNWT